MANNWIDDFIENYKTYTNTMKCLKKNSIDKQLVCLLRVKKKRKGKGKR